MLEGQKIITSILIASTGHIIKIQDAVESYLPSAAMSQGTAYGKIYYHAWNHAFKTRNRALKNELEICLQRMTIMAVNSRKSLLWPFHSLRKDKDVAKLLYSLFHPILFRFVTNPDGIIRANTTQLFLDIFPLEDPDEGIVVTDKELNDQMLLIRDLLIDGFPIVRSVTIIGLCISMSINWEVFSEDMLKTYFKVILNDLSCDSSSSDVRCAVAKGFKVLLENPLIFPTLQTILPLLRPLFHDISDAVRIAFCQLLLRVKKISSIKYYDIVPLDHLLARMEEDKVIAKTIVNLIHNSYFPKPDPERPKEYLNTCVARCIEMIKTDRGASRIFFQHIPSFIDVEYVAQFMIHAVKTVHFYVRNKMMSQRTDLCNISSESISEQDIEAMEEGLCLHDYNIVSGLIDAVSILWLSSHHNLEKPENKNLLKTIVAKLSKHLGDLSLFYKLTPVWQSIYYLCSFMPSRAIPTLASLCFYRLKELDSSTPYEEYMTLLECLCNQNESESLLNVLKEWIEQGFQQQIFKATPPATKE
ncbi:condensin-2 complex subunit G2 [Caerostris extrusa]|uniref:Condensin-2 complex subunit G2 n=1 Tax=Caerostris extrusa TaxID=172846 RepID=A0AAV4QXB4_CAEEX|nr:condensin-2 complex subunit G2 [Caerostris extrusa]